VRSFLRICRSLPCDMRDFGSSLDCIVASVFFCFECHRTASNGAKVGAGPVSVRGMG